MELNNNPLHTDFNRYLASQCSSWLPGGDDSYLAEETVQHWKHRQQLWQTIQDWQTEVDKVDGVLAALLFRMKKQLSRLGRQGAWSAWLREHRISRSTADRLVREHAETFGLLHELPHRIPGEPLEGDVCLAAHRTTKRLAPLLRTSTAKMTFIQVVGDILGLGVEADSVGAVRVSPAKPEDSLPIDNCVPNVMRIMEDGAIVPEDYGYHEEAIF